MLAAEQSEGGEARGISAEELLQTCGVEADGYAIGRTKVFLRQGILQELQRQRLEWIGLRAVHVQALMRGTMGRREAARRREERKRAAEMARRREEEARRREEEAKQRQQAVQKARALSFQRRAKKKVRGRLILTLTLILTSPSTLTLLLTTHHLPLCAPHHRSM